MKISVIAIAVNMAILTTLFTFINAFPNIKYLNYSFVEQMKDIVPPIVMSTIMGVSVFLVGKLLAFSDYFNLLVQIIVGISIYVTLSILTKNTEMKFILKLLFKNKLHG